MGSVFAVWGSGVWSDGGNKYGNRMSKRRGTGAGAKQTKNQQIACLQNKIRVLLIVAGICVHTAPFMEGFSITY